MANALEISDLSYAYPDGTPALHKINLKIKAQRKTVILGTNGSGKTTLIYHMNGTIPAQEGSVKVFDSPICRENIFEVRREVGLLFDNPDNQLFSTTVYGDIAFGPRNLRLDRETVDKRVKTAMHKVGIEELAERPPYSLSLGQKKRAAIAGLLAMKPTILACDEPFSGLDPNVCEHLRGIFNELKERGTTLVYSSHDVDLAYAWADDVVVMKNGRVLEAGEVKLLQDESLMRNACLPLPVLAELFKNSSYKPRTVKEALDLLPLRYDYSAAGRDSAVDQAK